MISTNKRRFIAAIFGILCAFALPDFAPKSPTATADDAAVAEKEGSGTTVQTRGTTDEARETVESRKSSDAARAKGEINFDDLKFDIEKDQAFDKSQLNEDVKSLHGKKVKIRGYILPTTLFKEKGIKQFVLVRDNQECCFGPGAALFDCIMVEMVPGKTTDFVTRPVTVEGKFQIDTESYKYPGGKGPKGASHLAIFKIAGDKVK